MLSDGSFVGKMFHVRRVEHGDWIDYVSPALAYGPVSSERIVTRHYLANLMACRQTTFHQA